MAELVLKNVDPSLVRWLQEEAERLGSTIESEAVRLLEVMCSHRAERALDDDSGEPGSGEEDSTPRPRSSPPASDQRDARPSALAERQAALAAAYPEEYVVLLGDRVLVHTRDKEEAYVHLDAAFDAVSGAEPIIVPPGPLRRIGPPVLRGRALPRTGGATRR